MLRFVDSVDQIAAVLHDAIEDTELTLDDLHQSGYPRDVIGAIDALTHRDRESYEKCIDRVLKNPVARRVKAIDLEDNLANNRRTPDAPGNAERIQRYEGALARLRIP